MKLAWMLIATTLTLATTGCATLPAQQQVACQPISPLLQGFDDGKKGLPAQNPLELMNACQSAGAVTDVSVFKNEYLKAYQKGIAVYCKPANGEHIGLLGQEYFGVCPREIEAPFLKEYLYALKQYNDAHPQPVPYYSPYNDPFWDYNFPRTPFPHFHHRR